MLRNLIHALAQNKTCQVIVKASGVLSLGAFALRCLRWQGRVPNSNLRYRVRFLDTFDLADTMFGVGEYTPIEGDAKQIVRFIDLGCNVGLFTVYLCSVRGDCNVAGVLVDANPSVVEEARANMRLNGISQVRVVHGLADSGTAGEERPFLVTANSLASTAHGDQLGTRFGSKAIRVPVVDVLSEFEQQCGADARVDLLKLDIEGCELDFARANEKLLSRTDRVILEFHKPRVTLKDATKFFEGQGFVTKTAKDNPSDPWGIAYFIRNVV